MTSEIREASTCTLVNNSIATVAGPYLMEEQLIDTRFSFIRSIVALAGNQILVSSVVHLPVV
jgi:hypothetical protein